VLAKISMAWLLATVGVMLKGESLNEFVRSSRVSIKAYVACSNNHNQYLVLVEYGGGGGWRGFIVILEGREVTGWSNCIVELRKVVAFLESFQLWEQGFKYPKVVQWFPVKWFV
jgi:hypothetical protein